MLDSPLVTRLIDLALEEDLPGGDVTSELTVDAGAQATARIIAREQLVVCGTGLIAQVMTRRAVPVSVEVAAGDGAQLKDQELIATLKGPARALLSTERVVLNFLQRLSGIATHTRACLAAAQGLTVLDTRKTLPGWRVLEKYAVKIGGARNHRMSLSDMIMVKNNHVDANGGDVASTLQRVKDHKPWYMPVEVEVRTIAELDAALPFSPEIVMLDNMSDDEMSRAMKLVEQRAPHTLVEVSGNVTAERFAALKALGVKAVSTSSLCGRARSVDISMRLALQRT